MLRRLGTSLSVVLVAGSVAFAPASGLPQATASAASCRMAPTYKPTWTRFGLSLSTVSLSFAQAARAKRQDYPNLNVVRVFDGGIPPWNAWANRTPQLRPHTAVIASFRMSPQSVLAGTYDTRLRHFFRTAPKGRAIFWSFHHEPEREIAQHKFTAAQYRAAFRHVAVVAHSTCRRNLFPTLILTGWTADPGSHRSLKTYYPGSRYVSVLGWDPYNSANSQPSSYRTPKALYSHVVAVSRRAHKPWGLAETGSGLVPGDQGAGRAAWLKRVGAYTRSHHAAFVSYFDSRDAVDYRLQDQPSKKAWRQVINGS